MQTIAAIVGAALLAAGVANAEPPVADSSHGPDFWLGAFHTHAMLTNGVDTLEQYGLTEEQKAAFLSEFERSHEKLKPKAGRRMRVQRVGYGIPGVLGCGLRKVRCGRNGSSG
jgi:hypothetical protein